MKYKLHHFRCIILSDAARFGTYGGFKHCGHSRCNVFGGAYCELINYSMVNLSTPRPSAWIVGCILRKDLTKILLVAEFRAQTST